MFQKIIDHLFNAWPLTCAAFQETEVGTNPVQVEVGEFDEAIEIEDVVESK